MLLKNLCRGAGIKCPEDSENTEINGISVSSDRVKNGDVFICIDGLHTDSHRFARIACEKGAAAVVAKEGKTLDSLTVPVIRVKDCREAAAGLFASYYGNPQNSMKIIGITGTNGKTTVGKMLYEILTKASVRCGLIGTVECLSPSGKIDIRSSNGLANMTTPDPEELYKILSVMKEDGAEYVIMEVTSHALALKKVSPIFFEYGIFTNLSEDHLDFHGNMEKYFEAKCKLFENCQTAVINCDDYYGRRLCDRIKNAEVIRLSAEGRRADYYAGDIRYDGSRGIEYKIISRKLRLRIRCFIPGNFTVMNSFEAAVCAHEIGVRDGIISSALLSMAGVSGRLEAVELGDGADFSVFIDYAHTPDALENLLKTARGFRKENQRIVLLFGCGGERDRYKRKIMGQIASNLADFVIVTSDNSRSEESSEIISEIMLGINKESCYTVIVNRKEAIEYAINNSESGDIILLAGKGHEAYEIDRNGKHPFSEKEIVREAYEKKKRDYHC